MTFKEFDSFQQEIFRLSAKMRDEKGKEYANAQDRFANFRRIESRLGIEDYLTGWVYLTKHLDSIEHYLKNKCQSDLTEPILGRFVDAITYLTLIAGMVEEYKAGCLARKQEEFKAQVANGPRES